MSYNYVDSITKENQKEVCIQLEFGLLTEEQALYVLHNISSYYREVLILGIKNIENIYFFNTKVDSYHPVFFSKPDKMTKVYKLTKEEIIKLIKYHKILKMSFEEFVEGVLIC